MEPDAIEMELSDLDTRIDRLRALYEQYFMGIERIEPQVPRKEVERRIQLLRREQIRNTALRFRFNTIVQRFNTHQQHWQRVTREIENGTYKRDVMRAAARLGEADALTILGKKRAKQFQALFDAKREREQPKRSDEVEVDLDADDFEDEPTLIPPPLMAVVPVETPLAALPPSPRSLPLPPPVPPSSGALPPPPPPPATLAARSSASRTGTLTQRGGAIAPAPMPRTDSGTQRSSVFPTTGARRPEGSSSGRSPVDLLNLDFEDFEAPRRPVPAPRTEPFKGLDSPFDDDGDDALTLPPPRTAIRATTPPGGQRPAGPSIRAVIATPNVAFRPSSGSIMPNSTEASRMTPSLGGPAPTIAPMSAPNSAATSGRIRAVMHSQTPLGSTPSPSASAPRPPPSRATASASDEALSEQRIRQIYAKYVEAKRAVNESTAGVTFEKLAESLRQQTVKLRASHPAKSVDYDVVVKDGKAHLKPILR